MEERGMASAADHVSAPNDHLWSRRKALFHSSTSIWLRLDYRSAFNAIPVICCSYSADQWVRLVHLQEKVEIPMRNTSHLVSLSWVTVSFLVSSSVKCWLNEHIRTPEGSLSMFHQKLRSGLEPSVFWGLYWIPPLFSFLVNNKLDTKINNLVWSKHIN